MEDRSRGSRRQWTLRATTVEVSDADLGWVVRRFRRRGEDSPGADAGVRLEGGDAVRVEVRGGGSTAGGVQGFGWSCAVVGIRSGS